MKPLIVIAASFALTGAAMAQTTQQPVTPSAGLYNSLHAVISNPDAEQPRRSSPPPAAPQPGAPQPAPAPTTPSMPNPGR